MTQQLKSNYFNAEKVLPILPVKQKKYPSAISLRLGEVSWP